MSYQLLKAPLARSTHTPSQETAECGVDCEHEVGGEGEVGDEMGELDPKANSRS